MSKEQQTYQQHSTLLEKLAILAEVDISKEIQEMYRDPDLVKERKVALQNKILLGIKAKEELATTHNRSNIYGAVQKLFQEMDGEIKPERLQKVTNAIDVMLLDREVYQQSSDVIDRIYEIVDRKKFEGDITHSEQYYMNSAIDKHVRGLNLDPESKKAFKEQYKQELNEAIIIKQELNNAFGDVVKSTIDVLNSKDTKRDSSILDRSTRETKLETLKSLREGVIAKEQEWGKQNPIKAAVMNRIPKKVISVLRKATLAPGAIKTSAKNVVNRAFTKKNRGRGGRG